MNAGYIAVRSALLLAKGTPVRRPRRGPGRPRKFDFTQAEAVELVERIRRRETSALAEGRTRGVSRFTVTNALRRVHPAGEALRLPMGGPRGNKVMRDLAREALALEMWGRTPRPTLREIGAALGVTRERARQIIACAVPDAYLAARAARKAAVDAARNRVCEHCGAAFRGRNFGGERGWRRFCSGRCRGVATHPPRSTFGADAYAARQTGEKWRRIGRRLRPESHNPAPAAFNAANTFARRHDLPWPPVIQGE